uniref:helix-turn-helix domain-containing protein n=1 Tax=Parerythrobacter lutipelagi TaxID=1964208 RepID=UPI0013758C31|nr:helix-turn-helix domain-containing protein [Parerythrobacter lutipelagi]
MRIEEKPEIARLPLFRDMDDARREDIFSGSFLQVFPAQLTLFEAGQQADFLHVLVDGLIELYVPGTARDTTIQLIEPVKSFILAAAVNDMPYLMSARTLTSSRVLLVPAARIRGAIKEDAALMQATMTKLALGYRDMVRALVDMKIRQSAERLGNYLLGYSAKHGDAWQFELSGEKRVLASLLGMTPENLSRAFGTLKQHGVNVVGARVRIEDREALTAFARPDSVPADPN